MIMKQIKSYGQLIFKIPFRSNLKIKKMKKFILSNQNNDFLVFNKKNGKFIKANPLQKKIKFKTIYK